MNDSLRTLQAAAAGGDRESQFRLGLVLARSGDAGRAAAWHRRAAAAGHLGASRELALFALFGLAGPVDLDAARAGLQASHAGGDPESAYWLALARSAGGEPGSAQVVDLLAQAAAAGDPRALRNLALFRADTGDLAGALAGLARAARAGDAHSAQVLVRLGASETPPADVATAARPPAPIRPWLRPEATVHCADPYVATCDRVFSALDCAHLIELGRPTLMPSQVVDPHSGRVLRDDYRTSSSTELAAFVEDPWALVLQNRLCELVDAPLGHAEWLSLLHYAPGQEYRPHRDYLPPPALKTAAGRKAGQRRYTVFAYLCDVEAGGGTAFPELDVTVEPRLGRAVLFHNLDSDSAPDPRTLHAGLPVLAGEKWLATLWLRERALRHAPPAAG
ncbi:MAG: 2OG-Fe(II) oxygenase [Xanthomonadales bacterium]|nr:2OG-Fe(II) oxygenase [Xanthomonadales bacterium]